MSEQFLNEVAHEAPVGPLVDRLRSAAKVDTADPIGLRSVVKPTP